MIVQIGFFLERLRTCRLRSSSCLSYIIFICEASLEFLWR